MADFAPLYILRHGQTEWNRAGRMQGRLNSPLTETGRAQASHQGDILRPRIGEALTQGHIAVRVSPQGRAVETAALALAGLAAMLPTDERLCEVDVGQWSGLAFEEIFNELPEESGPFDWYDLAPGGEGLAAVRARCESLLADLTGPTVLVCHGITSRTLRSIALGHRELLTAPEPNDGQGIIWKISAGQAECWQ